MPAVESEAGQRGREAWTLCREALLSGARQAGACGLGRGPERSGAVMNPQYRSNSPQQECDSSMGDRRQSIPALPQFQKHLHNYVEP